MEATPTLQQETVDQLYSEAAQQLVNKRHPNDVINDLKARGLDDEAATTIVSNLQVEISRLKKDRAKKDMLYGALWCIGGTVATLAEVGFIFWGAIIFGGIQFIKGLVNSAG